MTKQIEWDGTLDGLWDLYKKTPYLEGYDLEVVLAFHNKVFEWLKKADTEAKAADKLEGRYLRFPMGDGYAVYQIIEDKGKTIQLEWVPFACGDHWFDETVEALDRAIPRKLAEDKLRGRDAIEKLFSKRAK